MNRAGVRLFAAMTVVAAALVGFAASRDDPAPVPVVRVELPPGTTTSTTLATTTTSTTSDSVPSDEEPEQEPAPTPAEANDLVPPPPATTTTAPPAADVDLEWASTGEQRRTVSTVYCVSGLTYSGGQTHPEGPGVGRTAAVNRDNGEWERYAGTSWRVLTGPHAGAVYTIEDAGPAAHFDQWHGDRADCRAYALGEYGAPTVLLERVIPT